MDLGIISEGILSIEKKTKRVLTPSSENIAICAYVSFTFKLVNWNI